MTTDRAHRLATSMHPIEDHDTWMHHAEVAYRRLGDALGAVTADQWSTDTPCEGWTVRDLAGHVLGAMRSAATLRETISQQRAVAKRTKQTGESEVDALTAIQIERTATLAPAEVVREIETLIEPAVAGRGRIPGFVRRRAGFPVHMGTIDERWTLAYFLDCILTRYAWLHKVDLADALATDLRVDAHDAAIVGDVAAEWARRHGAPVRLTLSGPAGGTLVQGEDGDAVELDAIEFCRIVSGRSSHDHPLLGQEVPF